MFRWAPTRRQLCLCSHGPNINAQLAVSLDAQQLVTMTKQRCCVSSYMKLPPEWRCAAGCMKQHRRVLVQTAARYLLAVATLFRIISARRAEYRSCTCAVDLPVLAATDATHESFLECVHSRRSGGRKQLSCCGVFMYYLCVAVCVRAFAAAVSKHRSSSALQVAAFGAVPEGSPLCVD